MGERISHTRDPVLLWNAGVCALVSELAKLGVSGGIDTDVAVICLKPLVDMQCAMYGSARLDTDDVLRSGALPKLDCVICDEARTWDGHTYQFDAASKQWKFDK